MLERPLTSLWIREDFTQGLTCELSSAAVAVQKAAVLAAAPPVLLVVSKRQQEIEKPKEENTPSRIVNSTKSFSEK